MNKIYLNKKRKKLQKKKIFQFKLMVLEKGANGLIVWQRISPEIHIIIPKIHPISQNHFFKKLVFFKAIVKIHPINPISLKNKF